MSYEKLWNFAIGERESGKTVDSWFLVFNAFYYKNRPSVIFRRRIADMSPTYINDVQNVLNKFLENPIELFYIQGDIKTGIVDVKMAPAGTNPSYAKIKKMPTFFRVIGLSNPMNRIKSMSLKDVRYFFFDEFIANIRGGEKYLTADEYFLIQEVYNTYNREASTPITILAAGNPYSVYNPLFSGLNVDTTKVKPGAFIVGPNYTINCFRVPQELKEQILAKNPLYQFDDAYKRYAFEGQAINDQNIRIHKCEPKGFKLRFVFKINNEYLSIHSGAGKDEEEGEFKFWVCKHKSEWLDKVSKNRKIFVLNFKDMIAGAVKVDREMGQRMVHLKMAFDRRHITFNTVDAHYLLEELYPWIQ